MKVCPKCRGLLKEAVQHAGEERKPEAGDYTVCGECGYVLVFYDNQGTLALRQLLVGEAIPEELRQLLLQAREKAHIEKVNPLHVDDLKHEAWKGAKNR